VSTREYRLIVGHGDVIRDAASASPFLAHLDTLRTRAHTVIVYDVSNQESFEALPRSLEELEELGYSTPESDSFYPSHSPTPRLFTSRPSSRHGHRRHSGPSRRPPAYVLLMHIPIQEYSQQVPTSEDVAFAARTGCLFVEASAKTAQAFNDVVVHIIDTPSLWREEKP